MASKSEATNSRRVGQGKSALAMVVIVVMVIVIIAAVAYALTQPGVLESVVTIAVVAAVIIVAAVVIIGVAVALIALPMYAYKGERYQENVDYGLDGVEPVEGKTDADEPGGH